MVQLLLCVAAVAFAILAKSMDAGFLPQLSQAMDTVLSQGVDFSQENTFAHFAGGMVDGLRESARQVMAQLDGAAQTASSAPAQGGYLPVQKDDTPPEGFSMDAYVPKQPLYSPVQGTLTSGYGYRDNPVNGQEDFHAGLDIAVAEGTPVHCAQDGRWCRPVLTAYAATTSLCAIQTGCKRCISIWRAALCVRARGLHGGR